MIDRPKISIGIPVYNRKDYIEKCAQSLFEQSYENIEFIFVDDGSTDGSITLLYKILDNYSNRKSQVKVITHDKNYGLWKTRNTIIDNMSGDYLSFCDSDDWVDKNYYETMINAALTNNSDIIITPYFEDRENTSTAIKANKCNPNNLNSIFINTLYLAVWNKLFRRSLIDENRLRVPEGINCWEDVSITSIALALSKKTTYIDIPFYHYRKESQSSYTSLNHKKRLNDQIKCAKYVDGWFANKGKEFYKSYELFLNKLKFSSKIKMLRGNEITLKLWKETFAESNNNIFAYNNLNIAYRILFYLAIHIPSVITMPIVNSINHINKIARSN